MNIEKLIGEMVEVDRLLSHIKVDGDSVLQLADARRKLLSMFTEIKKGVEDASKNAEG